MMDGLATGMFLVHHLVVELILYSSPERLPSLLGSSHTADGPEEMVDITLCDEEDMVVNVNKPGMESPQTPSGSVHLRSSLITEPFLPIFPLHTFTVPDDYDGLVVPTSDPHEVEYPYMIVPSLETRLARRM